MRELGNFKMERPGQVEVGDVVDIREGSLPNSVYYYVAEPAVAMSANIPLSERLLDHDGNVITKGKVIRIDETDRGYYLTLEFEE
ncbi:MAG: hypothetical protein K6G60_00030 [Lachnospiraceae bacterium]|nr:hypothetical protein [Lachnospiraceae bacterium]